MNLPLLSLDCDQLLEALIKKEGFLLLFFFTFFLGRSPAATLPLLPGIVCQL
jgi:hypothetical protein